MTKDDTDVDEMPAQDARGETDSAPTEDDWSDVSSDPDPAVLGYEREQWERISTGDSDQLVFLPSNEEDIAEDAFVVLDESDLTDLVTRR